MQVSKLPAGALTQGHSLLFSKAVPGAWLGRQGSMLEVGTKAGTQLLPHTLHGRTLLWPWLQDKPRAAVGF